MVDVNVQAAQYGRMATKIIDTKKIEGVYRKQFLTDSWQRGVYFIKLRINDSVETIRLVKI